MKEKIIEKLRSIVKKEFPDFNIELIKIEEADIKFGDYSCNVAFIIAKENKDDPKNIAEKLMSILKNDEIFTNVSVAGPGFINFFIAPEFLQKEITNINKMGDEYGSSDLGKDLKVNVEFISANPTGPLTVGNSRGGIIGDVLSNIFQKSGWEATREYYFNDAGGQIDVLGHSILKDDEAQYKGEYIDNLANEIKGDEPREVGKEAAKKIIRWIKETTAKMGIRFDVWTAEGKDLRDTGKLDKIIAWLKENKLAYESEGAWWFKSTQFSDDKDRVIVKSNGDPTYFALDCAYHKDKFDRGFDKAIDVWGADHHGDVARIKGFVKALGFEKKFDILMHQFVRIVKDGREVRMSKREGNYILVDDLLREVGKDVYRFFMLTYAPNSHLVFDLDLAKEKSQKNPVYYVQYAYARIHSILAKIKNEKSEIKNIDYKLLNKPEELALIKQLIKLPELVSEIVGDYQVQKLTTYAIRLAESFHHFYEKCPVINAESEELKLARSTLLEATQIVLKNTLDLMGISAPEKM